jgi:hypothetical protein
VLAEQIDACASAAARPGPARASPSGSEPDRLPSLASVNTSTLPTASKEPRRYHRGCQWPSTALIGD